MYSYAQTDREFAFLSIWAPKCFFFRAHTCSTAGRHRLVVVWPFRFFSVILFSFQILLTELHFALKLNLSFLRAF